MKLTNLREQLVQKVKQLGVAVSCLMALTLIWQGLFLVTAPGAIALPRDAYSNLSSESNGNAGTQVKQNARSVIDGIAGAGTADQMSGQAKQAFGKAQQKAGEAKGKMKGAAKQVEGRAQKDLGRTENAAEKARDKAGNAADNAIDAVKDFFN